MRLDAAAAQAAVATLAARLGMAPEQAAEGIVAIAVAHLLQATRQVSVERGHDPRDFAMVAFGGAGPVFAATLAEELGVGTVFVPPDPGVMSAAGLLAADFRRDYVRTLARPLAAMDDAAMRDALQALRAEAEHDIAVMRPEGTPRFEPAADLRYAGQGYELTVPITPADIEDLAGPLAGRFHALHRTRFGHAYPKEAVRLVNLRLRLTVPQPGIPMQRARSGADAAVAETGELHWRGHRLACRFLARAGLAQGDAVEGPAVIEEDTASTLIPPGWRGRLDAGGGLVITRQEESA
jgi:N-methylhydantoinase A